jgi:pyruvate/2-oxoglutarate dehydrogenase complex dihydrolipoamide dehydrogenase (E3) component
VVVDAVRIDFPAVMQHVKGAIATIEPADSVATLQAAGVHVVHGDARFTGPDRVEVDGQLLLFRRAVVATGAAPALPPVPGLSSVRPLTSDTVWDLADLPERLVVLGAGSIGCELGQAFARLGAQVTLVEERARILVGEDPDAARLVHAALEEDGVRVLTGHRAVSVTGADDGAGRVVLDRAGEQVAVEFDRVLAAVGRAPRTCGLQLEVAGVQVDDDGYVVVDEALRTPTPASGPSATSRPCRRTRMRPASTVDRR